jgi:hypothetical protein
MNNEDRRDLVSSSDSSDIARDALSLKPSVLDRALRIRSGLRCGIIIECCHCNRPDEGCGGPPPPPPPLCAV